MLEFINKFDTDRYNFVKFFEQFEYRGFTCLVFEVLDCNLYDLMRERHGIPLSPAEIRPIAQQVRTTQFERNVNSCQSELMNRLPPTDACGSGHAQQPWHPAR